MNRLGFLGALDPRPEPVALDLERTYARLPAIFFRRITPTVALRRHRLLIIVFLTVIVQMRYVEDALGDDVRVLGDQQE